jgi:hypothetical protein
MRRFLVALTMAGLAGLAFGGAALVTSAAPQAAGNTSHGFSVTGSTAGGVSTASNGDPLTFVFSEVNVSSSSTASEDIALLSLTNASIGSISCVFPNHSLFHPDGSFCEPGALRVGQKASSVTNATVTGSSGSTVTAHVCLENEGTGYIGPCQNVSVHVA